MSEQSEAIAFLSNPDSYGPGIPGVDRHETHGSIVFLAGDRAYKLKRAVTYPYMDYGTIERRRIMCERELAVNRRTAPMLYLGVQPVVRRPSGNLTLGEPGAGDIVLDWLVVMRRFDQSCLLDELRRKGTLTVPLVRRAVDQIAQFHAGAEVTPAYGGADAIIAVVSQNRAAFEARLGRPFGRDAVLLYGARAADAVRKVAALLDMRRDRGDVRRCHGDLHLNNICLVDGKPLPFDAIEFNDAFSCIDVLYDLAFLVMDLERHGLALHANAALNRYLEQSPQHDGLAAMPLFLSCRAAVRAHVAASTSDAVSATAVSEAKCAEAVSLLARANLYLAESEPRLVAVGGLSGTGKSTLARALAPLFKPSPGAIVLRSDVIRKRLLGVGETVRLPETAYTPEVTRQVYAQLTELAEITLAAGYSVIADAVFGREDERRMICRVAARLGRPFAGLWLRAPLQDLQSRVAVRQGDASDATADVVAAQERYVTAPADWLHVDADPEPETVLRAARGALAI